MTAFPWESMTKTTAQFYGFFDAMAKGYPLYLTPFYTKCDGEEIEDEFLEEKKVQIVISTITANSDDCSLSITFKVTDVHEAILCKEFTLNFSGDMLCSEIPDDMYVEEEAEPENDAE